MYLESRTKRIFGIACLAKKFYYYSKVRTSGSLEVHPPCPVETPVSRFPPPWHSVHLNCGDVSFFSDSTVTSVTIITIIFAIACLGKKFNISNI